MICIINSAKKIRTKVKRSVKRTSREEAWAGLARVGSRRLRETRTRLYLRALLAIASPHPKLGNLLLAWGCFSQHKFNLKAYVGLGDSSAWSSLLYVPL